MKYVIVSAWLLAGASCAALASAANPKPAQPSTIANDWEAKVQRALLLAGVLGSDETTNPLTGLDDFFVASLRQSPDVQQIEAQLPGFTERYYAALRPELQELLRAKEAALHQRIAEIRAKHATVANLDAAIEFYRGPVGQKVSRSKMAAVDVSSTVDAVAKANSVGSYANDPAAKAIASEERRLAVVAASSLSSRETAVHQAFLHSPSYQALMRAQPEIDAARSEWRSQKDLKWEARMAEIAEAVIVDMQSGNQANRQ